VLLLCAVLAACARTPSQPDPPSAERPTEITPVTITWSFWGDERAVELNRRLVALFEREHPDIRVDTVHQPWRDYFDWLWAEWRDGRAPDVMFLNFIPSYAPSGELAPLEDYVARDAVDLGDFYPALLEGFRAAGHLYGLPRDNDTKVIYYNRAHFRATGLAEPHDDWTWDDLRTAALALTQRDPAAPRYGLGLELDYWWLVWMWQHGCPVVDNATAPATLHLEGTACNEALQFLQDLIQVDRVTPPLEQMTTDGMNRLFRTGQLSMVLGNHALVPWFANTAELEWQVAPLPRDVARANVAGGAGFVVSRRSQHPEAAWQLVRFLTERKAQALMAESGEITPARRSVREDSIFLRQHGYRAELFRTESLVGRPIPNFPGVTDFYRLLNEGLRPVWRGERRPAEALRDLIPELQRLIDDAAVR
jgi:multiple sugar transport system substrate-binding protein